MRLSRSLCPDVLVAHKALAQRRSVARRSRRWCCAKGEPHLHVRGVYAGIPPRLRRCCPPCRSCSNPARQLRIARTQLQQQEAQLIAHAKHALMARLHVDEAQAHAILQKARHGRPAAPGTGRAAGARPMAKAPPRNILRRNEHHEPRLAAELDARVAFIREQLRQSSATGVVLGNNGRKDSALVAILCKRATDNVKTIILPCGSSRNFGIDRDHALLVARQYGIDTVQVDLTQIKRAVYAGDQARVHALTQQASMNYQPRLRMITVYAVAVAGVSWRAPTTVRGTPWVTSQMGAMARTTSTPSAFDGHGNLRFPPLSGRPTR